MRAGRTVCLISMNAFRAEYTFLYWGSDYSGAMIFWDSGILGFWDSGCFWV